MRRIRRRARRSASRAHSVCAALSAAGQGVETAERDDDRCATPGCDGKPRMTYLDRRLCDACWTRHCNEQDAARPDDIDDVSPRGPDDGDDGAAVPLAEALATSDVAQ